MSKTKKDVMTDPLLRKAHAHPLKYPEPIVCPDCKGSGCEHNNKHTTMCKTCQGLGEIYE